jgi:UDP-glucose 4-epimerase
MKCIVTGASGFIGSHLTDLLLNEGHEVIGIDDLSTGNLSNLAIAKEKTGFRFIHKSVLDLTLEDLEGASIDWIFHIAGRADLVPSIENPEDYFDVNVKGTLKMLELARTCEVKKFVYTASSTCYGIPDTYPTPEDYPCVPKHPYGQTKMMGEELALFWHSCYGIPVNSLRLFNVYGPRSRTSGAYGAVFGVFLKQKLEGVPFTVVGYGEQTRDFTYVSDVARAFLAAADTEVTGQIMNVGSGGSYSINRLVTLLEGEIQYIPKRPGEPDTTFADITKIRSLLKWESSVSFEEGVKNMLDCIENWREAPLWDEESIKDATKDWFKYLK